MDTVSISEDLVNKLSGEMTVVVAADSSNSNLEKLNEAVTTASGNKTRKSRRRRTRNTNVTNSDSKVNVYLIFFVKYNTSIYYL